MSGEVERDPLERIKTTEAERDTVLGVLKEVAA
jgi:hypothetical protein